ncbi:colicin E5-related ribonuclease, partial [Alkalibacillus haloalkaliphilus]|uniref:colicin E5-related ribonuclease n=1 Tax=Alkalibacillus haloalkaliphilus TaxID=94136 RepID=UPI001FEAFB7E
YTSGSRVTSSETYERYMEINYARDIQDVLTYNYSKYTFINDSPDRQLEEDTIEFRLDGEVTWTDTITAEEIAEQNASYLNRNFAMPGDIDHHTTTPIWAEASYDTLHDTGHMSTDGMVRDIRRQNAAEAKHQSVLQMEGQNRSAFEYAQSQQDAGSSARDAISNAVSTSLNSFQEMGDELAESIQPEHVSLGADLTPYIGNAKGVIEGISGKDLITEEELAWWQRAFGFTGPVLKLGEKGVGFFFRGGKGNVSFTYDSKIAKQMNNRGWNDNLIQNTLQNPHRTQVTRDTRYRPDGTRNNDPATAYIRDDGSYVVRNDRTGDIVQVSKRNDPNWVPPWD